jgi:hypothetical protein
MRYRRSVLGVAIAALVLLTTGLPAAESGPGTVVCLKPAWGNITICG